MANPHPEPHPENLKPFKKKDPASVETQRKGGKASAEAHARKRTMREWAKFYGELPLHPGETKDPESEDQIRDTNQTMDGAVIAAMYAKATKGDARAANFLATMKGELVQEVTVHTDPLAALTEDQIDAILGTIKKTRKSKQ